MTTFKRVLALSGCMLLGATSVVQADTTQGSDVQAELSAMRSRIAQLEGQQNQSWLNERRAEEVKSLVREVLSDADTRASLADGGNTAHIDSTGIMISSEDGRTWVRFNGQIQTRWSYNAREGDQIGTQDKNDGMFSTPRVKMMINGQVADPRLTFHIQIAANGNFDDFDLEEYTISYELADGLTVWGGLATVPVVRGDIIDSSHTLAADRGLFETFYTPGRAQGLGVIYHAKDSMRLQAMVLDNASIEFGLAGRAEFKVSGEWDQLEDFNAWSGEGQLLVLGLGGTYFEGAHGVQDGFNYATIGVADVAYENNGLGLYFAAAASNSKSSSGTYQTYGLTAQGNYMIVADKFEGFARYDYIDRTDGPSDINLLTFGVNYYLNKHAAKFTFDMQYAPRPVTFTPFGSDLNIDNAAGDGNRNQVTFRAQFQLLF